MKHSSSTRGREGFTLLEILLAVALLGILAGIVILALNPAKQLADTRNAQRKVDVNTILNAVYQYTLDNNGNLPGGIPTAAPAEVCLTGSNVASATCGALVDLEGLTTIEKYLVRIPTDPSGATSTCSGLLTACGTGYNIQKTVNGRIVVSARGQEQGVTISVSR